MRIALLLVIATIAGCVSSEPLEGETFLLTNEGPGGLLFAFEGNGTLKANYNVVTSPLERSDYCISIHGSEMYMETPAGVYAGVVGAGQDIRFSPISFDAERGPIVFGHKYIFVGIGPEIADLDLELSADSPITVTRTDYSCVTDPSQLEGDALVVGAHHVGEDLSLSGNGHGFYYVFLTGEQYAAHVTPGNYDLSGDLGSMSWSWAFSDIHGDFQLDVAELRSSQPNPIIVLLATGLSEDAPDYLTYA